MVDDVVLKVYNKEDKLKLTIRDSKAFKAIIIYKYNGENIDSHTYVMANEGELKPWQAYYELQINKNRILKESLIVSEMFVEHHDFVGENEIIKTTTNLQSGNQYEKRIKYFKGEKYEVEFKNGELNDFNFNLQENKINEYLETLKQ